MTEQWQELKETITEMRDNDGTGTQQDVCKFLADYMEVLEKQMQQPCEDCISREHAKQFLYYEIERLHDDGLYDCFSKIIDDMYNELPSVTPKYTDEEIDKAQAVEQAYVDKMVELAVAETKRPKGKWMECGGYEPWLKGYCCSLCNFTVTNKYNYCPDCGAEMSGGGEDEDSD